MIDPIYSCMSLAIYCARKAAASGDYAIGAVIANREGRILVSAGNRVKIEEDPTNHAEVVAIRKASRKLKTRHLDDYILYATHEPCPMCTSVAIWARLAGIVYGAKIEDMAEYSKKNGNSDYSWRTIDIRCKEVVQRARRHSNIEIVEAFLRKECVELFHSGQPK